MNDYSFDVQVARGEKGGLNEDTHTEEVPKYFRGQSLSNTITGANRSPNKVSSKTNFVGKGRCNGCV